MDLCHYTSDDTSSDSDLLDRSLSMWIGWEEDQTIGPIPLDLHTAASLGDYDCVKDLLSRPDTAPDRPNRSRWTPLMYASYIGHGSIVRLLISASIDVNRTTDDGSSALILAASSGKDSVVHILHQNGAKLDSRNQRGWSALFAATFSGHQSTVQLLVGLGADVHRAEHSLGLTPLMLAAAEGHEVIAGIFLEKGVNVSVKNKRGDTARSLAVLNEHMSIVALIDSWNALPSALRSDPDLSSSDDGYPLPGLPQHRRSPSKIRGPSIQDGPALFAKMVSERRHLAGHRGPSKQSTFGSTVQDLDSGSKTASNPFCISNAVTIRSSVGPNSRKSENFSAIPGSDSRAHGARDSSKACPGGGQGLPGINSAPMGPGSSREGSLSSNADDDDDDSDAGISCIGLDQYFTRLNFSDARTKPNLVNFGSHQDNTKQLPMRDLGPPPLVHKGTSGGMSYDPTGDHPILNKNNRVNFDPLTQFQGVMNPGHFHEHVGVTLQPGRELVSHVGYIPSIPPLSIPSREFDNRSGIAPPFPNCDIPLRIPSNQNELNPSVAENQHKLRTDGIARENTMLPRRAGEKSRRPPSGTGDVADLRTFLKRLDLTKYLPVFEGEDIDLRVFLTLTDSDLKEVGIKLMGPRRKMTNAIARWHVGARALSDDLEQVYADRMENALQETKEKYQQVLSDNNELEAQLAQERELRRVVEGCLMKKQFSPQLE